MKERLDFLFQEKIKTMDRVAIIQDKKKLLKQWLDFPVKEKVISMDTMDIIRGQKILETTVRFSISRKD